MKVGDLIKFSKKHWTKPGLDYARTWSGLIVDIMRASTGEVEELHILWDHGVVNDYPASWWNRLSYEPFKIVSTGRELTEDELEHVRGGMNYGQFNDWRCGIINENE